MAISVTKPIAGVASTANATSYAMTAFTPTANSLLLVGIVATGTVLATPTMTGGGLTWVFIQTSGAYNVSADSVYMFYAKVGASPISTTPTFDCTGDAATGTVMMLCQMTGYDNVTSNPIRKTGQTAVNVTGGQANPNFSWNNAFSADPNNAQFAVWGGQLAANSSTPPTGWTEGDDLGYSTPTTNGASAYRASGESGSNISFTAVTSQYGILGVDVYASGLGPVSAVSYKLGLLGVG